MVAEKSVTDSVTDIEMTEKSQDSRQAAMSNDEKQESKPPQFGKIQQWVFPIYNDELLKVVPVILMMLAALFVYTTFRDIKDGMVFQEEGQSLMTVQWCKVFVMIIALPVATLFFKLDNVVSREFIFFQTVFTFVAYFMLNCLVLYPNRAALHSSSNRLMRDVFLNSEAVMVDRYYPILGALLFPISTLHYIVSELWGTLSVSFLLWGYVNQITPKECAKRYYGVLGLGAQLGPILAGKTVEMVTHGGDGTEESFIASIRNLNYICLIGEIGFAALYAFMCYYVMKLPRFALKPVKKKKSQPKMSVGAAIKYCASDLYVMSLSGIVFAYGFVMVAGELVYKDVVKLSFDHDAEAFSGFKGMESTLAACLSMFLMLFVAHNVIRLFGWTITALLAPAIATLTASLFYILALSSDIFTDEDNTRHPTSYTINVLRYIGLLFVVAVKGTKYASFDPAKELAFLPLSNEEKYKAKAAVDIVGARFGKGCGALFNIFIINWGLGKKETYFTDTLVASFVAVLLVIALWVISDLYIGREKPNRELKRLEADSKLDLQHVTIGGDRDGDTATVELSAQCDAQLEIRTALPTPDASTTDVTVQ